ncbi:MAG: WD40 repeat domain-containing protein [Planctomycetota bacterium]
MPADPAKAKVASQWPYTSPLISCRWQPNGKYLFSTAEDNSIQRWDPVSGEKISLAAHDSWVFALGVTPDGQTLLSAGGDGQLIWWPANQEAPAPIRRVAAHQGWIRQLAVSPDGKTVATAGNDQVVKLWNISDGSLVKQFTGHENQIYSVLFHPAGQQLVSGDLLGMIRHWDIAQGTQIRSVEAKDLHSYNGGQGVHFGGIRALAFSADAKQLACGGLHKAENPLGAVHEPLVVVLDWVKLQVAQTHIAEGVKGSLGRLHYHPQGFLVGVSGGSSGGFLLFWKAQQNKELHRFALPNLARDMDLHADLVQVATTHFDKKLRLTRLDA